MPGLICGPGVVLTCVCLLGAKLTLVGEPGVNAHPNLLARGNACLLWDLGGKVDPCTCTCAGKARYVLPYSVLPYLLNIKCMHL